MIAVFSLSVGRTGRLGVRRLSARTGAAGPAASATAAAGAVRAQPVDRDRRPRRGAVIADKVADVSGVRVPARPHRGDRRLRRLGGRDRRAARRAAAPRSCSTCRAWASSLRSTGPRRCPRARFSSSPTPTPCSSPARCASSSRTSPTRRSAASRRTSSAAWRRTGGRSPAAKALLALRASAQAARGPGRERRLGQRPPVRGAPQRCSGPSTLTTGTDDFLISSQVVTRAAARLAFDERAIVLVATPERGPHRAAPQDPRDEPRAASAFALGYALLPTRTGLYGVEVVCHKILRRFVAFFLLAALVAQRRAGGARPRLVDRPRASARVLRARPGRGAPRRHALGPAQAAVDPLLLLPGQPGGGARRAVAARRRALRATWEPVGARGSTRSPAVSR